MADQAIEFDAGRARRFKKRSKILAFRPQDPVTFHKSWGEQKLDGGAWVAVALDADGTPTTDIYGIDAAAFEATYAPVEGAPNTFEKNQSVEAYQPGVAFEVQTKLGDRVETERATGGASHWLVRNPGGELYTIEDEVFRRTYAPVDGD